MIDLFISLRLALLDKDIDKIIHAYDTYSVHDIYPSILKDQYKNEKELYDDMVMLISEKQRQNELVDMIPYIDEYIDIYFSMN